MSTFLNNIQTIVESLLTKYDKVMVLKIFVDSPDAQLKDMYYNAAFTHNSKLLRDPFYIDAGFDLFAPRNEENTYDDLLPFFGPSTLPINKLDFQVCCSAKTFLDYGKNHNTCYYMYPRSSLSKTPLRLANSIGIIDAGYRGHLIGMFDSSTDYVGKKYDKYLQICAPGLGPIIVDVVNTKEELGEETIRGAGGFGSTGT